MLWILLRDRTSDLFPTSPTSLARAAGCDQLEEAAALLSEVPPTFRSLCVFSSFKKAAILSAPRFIVGWPLRTEGPPYAAGLMGFSLGVPACFKEARTSANSVGTADGATPGRVEELEASGGGGGGGGGGGAKKKDSLVERLAS